METRLHGGLPAFTNDGGTGATIKNWLLNTEIGGCRGFEWVLINYLGYSKEQVEEWVTQKGSRTALCGMELFHGLAGCIYDEPVPVYYYAIQPFRIGRIPGWHGNSFPLFPGFFVFYGKCSDKLFGWSGSSK